MLALDIGCMPQVKILDGRLIRAITLTTIMRNHKSRAIIMSTRTKMPRLHAKIARVDII
jgi:hypothetical protein